MQAAKESTDSFMLHLLLFALSMMIRQYEQTGASEINLADGAI